MKSSASNAAEENGSYGRTCQNFAHFTVYVSVLYQLAYVNVKITSYIDEVPIMGLRRPTVLPRSSRCVPGSGCRTDPTMHPSPVGTFFRRQKRVIFLAGMISNDYSESGVMFQSPETITISNRRADHWSEFQANLV